MKHLRLILILLLLMPSAVMAIYPSGKIKFHNAKLKSHKKEKLNNKWLNFIEEYPEVLRKKDKPYKMDQYCSFSLALNEDSSIDLDSLKLLKHRKNFAYNLKAIQFLRETDIKLKRKNTDSDIEVEFKYFSF